MSSAHHHSHHMLHHDTQWTTPLTTNTTACCASSSSGSSLTSSNSFAMDSLASGNSSSASSSNADHHMDEPKRSYSACALSLSDSGEFSSTASPVGMFERKPYRPFRSNEEYLVAMKEDLAEWLNMMYAGLDLSADNFLNRLETGVVLCRHANSVLRKAREGRTPRGGYSPPPCKQQFFPSPLLNMTDVDLDRDVPVKANAPPGTFQARDNVANFIDWCRRIRIHECLLFETEDLVARKNEKSFVLCLLEVARYGAKLGLLAPTLVQFEQEIEQELEKDQQQAAAKQNGGVSSAASTDRDRTLSLQDDDGSLFATDNSPPPQITNNDLESLHEKVVNLLSRCTCPVQFYLEHLSEGKYRIGDTRTLIFVRILRNHVMVRVGGGWDTLEHYLEKHDPCRCRFGHRYSSSARISLNNTNTNHMKSSQMQVTIERPDSSSFHSSRRSVNSSPSAVRRQYARPNSSSNNLNSMNGGDVSGIRRASTSSNDSTSSASMCSVSSLVAGKCDSLCASSDHSSLSSNHSLGSFPPTPAILPDRNNNIKELAQSAKSSSPSPLQSLGPTSSSSSSKPIGPSKKRILSALENSSSRIPKSKAAFGAPAPPFKSSAFNSSPRALTGAHKLKSTSSLAISQFSSSTSKIPCFDASASSSSTKSRAISSGRYSTHNIYLAVSGQERTATDADSKLPKRLLFGSSVQAPKQRTRSIGGGGDGSGLASCNNLVRSKQKSSLELNVCNENFYSFSHAEKVLEQQQQVPNNKPKNISGGGNKETCQQHRRHHSSSSLPQVGKSLHNSPYTKRRDTCSTNNSGNVCPGFTTTATTINGPSGGNRGSANGARHVDRIATANTTTTASKLDRTSVKRFQGSATSLNSTFYTGNSSSDSNSDSNSSLNSPMAAGVVIAENLAQIPRQLPKTAPIAFAQQQQLRQQSSTQLTTTPLPSSPSPAPPSLPYKTTSFINTDKKTPPSALVEVCSWLERNHLAS